MSTAVTGTRRLRLGPQSAGLLLTAAEFDRAQITGGWRYEMINGVLVVPPASPRNERNRNVSAK